MRKVVITGIGIVSCIGNNQTEVLDSLLKTRSGIVFSEDHQKYNFRSQVVGEVKNLNLSVFKLINPYFFYSKERICYIFTILLFFLLLGSKKPGNTRFFI